MQSNETQTILEALRGDLARYGTKAVSELSPEELVAARIRTDAFLALARTTGIYSCWELEEIAQVAREVPAA